MKQIVDSKVKVDSSREAAPVWRITVQDRLTKVVEYAMTKDLGLQLVLADKDGWDVREVAACMLPTNEVRKNDFVRTQTQLLRAGAAVYTEQVPVWIVSVQRKDTLAIERYTLFDRELPDYFPCFEHQWTRVWITKVLKEPLIFGRVSGKSNTLRLKKAKIVNSARNRDHERVFIRLSDETTVTCPRTGISFKVTLPSQAGTNLVLHHPLSLSSNCLDLLAQCSRHGVMVHARYERQILAGMVITLLRSKNLVELKDPVKANLFLQRASGSSLNMLLQYITSLSSAIGLPSMSLNDTRENALVAAWDRTLPENIGLVSAEVLIHNFVRDCKAARTSKTSKEARAKRVTGVRVHSKTYTNAVTAEATSNKAATAGVKHAMKMLTEKYFKEHQTYIMQLEFTLKNAEFLSAQRRKYFAKELTDKFAGDVDAETIAKSLTAVKTDALEQDIAESFVAGTESGGKREKVDFMKYLKVKKQDTQ